MINFKNHKQDGVGFIEVIISIFIAGLLLSSMFSLQNASWTSFKHYVGRAQRLVMMRNELSQEQLAYAVWQGEKNKEALKPRTKIIDDPPTDLSLEKSTFPDKSRLNKQCHLQAQRLIARWDALPGSQQDVLLQLLYIPELPKKDKP